MDEGELRRTARQRFGKQIPEWIWGLLRDDHYLDSDDEDAREEALSRIQRLLQITLPAGGQPRRRPGSVGTREHAPRLSTGESLRALAASEYLAKDAERLPEVQRFRQDILDGRLLTRQEVTVFLASRAAQCFSLWEFQVRGVPPARHSARIVNENATYGDCYHVVIHVEPPSVDWTFERKPVGVVWSGSNRALGHKHVMPIIEGRPIDAWYWNGSVIDDLMELDRVLREERHYPWTTFDGAWLVMTGEAPIVRPLTAAISRRMGSHSNRVTITMTVEPWVSVGTLASYYRQRQRELLRRHNRPISERRLVLVRFVLAQTDEQGEVPSWRVMMQEWNRAHPAWRYRDVRNMARDYWSAARQVVFPRASGGL